MYKRNANPVYAFLIDECEPGEATDYIEKTLFYNAFRDYAQAHGIRPLSSKKFSELLIDQTEVPVSTFRPYIEHGDRPMCWQGVKFKDRATVCQSRMSRVPPTPSSPENEIEGKRGEKKIEGKIGIRKILDILDVVTPGEQRKPESGEKSPVSPPLAEKTRKTTKPSPSDLEKVRILKRDGYRTQIPLPDNPNKFVDHLFNFSEVVEVQHWRAEDLIERGIAEPAGTGA
jgi:phage/plasmid-associated DNA primase